MTLFSFDQTWRFDAPPPAVWDAVRSAEMWPRWWPDVEVEPAGDGVYRCAFRSPLGWAMRVELRIIDEEPPHRLRVEVGGHLRGVATAEFATDGQGGTRSRYRAHVRTQQPLLDLLAPGLRPVLGWNHHLVMRRGARRLTEHLERQR